MTTGISEQYRLLAPEEVDAFASECALAWQDPEIPRRQYDLVVAGELEKFRAGEPVLPYDALASVLYALPTMAPPSLLDVGAASGYYREVLKIRRFDCRYTAVDFSQAFKDEAELHFPGIHFDIGDARSLPYADGQFDIVLHSAAIMHIREYAQAIREAARVSRRYVIFHRTAVVMDRSTEFWAKTAYDVPTMEIHIEYNEFLRLTQAAGLKCLSANRLFFDEEQKSGHYTFIMEKQ